MSNLSFPVQRYLFNSAEDTSILCFNALGVQVPTNDATRTSVHIQQVGEFLLAAQNLVGKTIIAGANPTNAVATVTGFPTATAGQELVLYIKVENLSNFGENLELVNNPYEKRYSFVADAILTATEVATRFFQIITKRNDLNRFTVTDNTTGTLTFTFLEAATRPFFNVERVDFNTGGTGGQLPLTVAFTTAPSIGQGNYPLLTALFADNAMPYQPRYERSKLPQEGVLYRTYILTYRPVTGVTVDNNGLLPQEFTYEIYVNEGLTALTTALNQALA